MKYRAIYKVIQDSADTTVNDRSNWRKHNQTLIDRWKPLWIILENRRVNLRLWVIHEHGKLKVDTAQLDLNCNSKEYSDSQKRYICETQSDMAALLKRLLSGE
jgi:hypothetical protein